MNWAELFKNNHKTNLKTIKQIYRKKCFDTKGVKIISVVGTNGKGSVANYLAQGLISKHKRVGLFTSPHLLLPNERIIINKTKILDEEVEKILSDNPEFKNLHFFAMMFLVAMTHFFNKGVDVIILEAGIGGAKDATNAAKANYGVVTSIGFDHKNLLGDSLVKIAKDKSGIINQGMNFFIPYELDHDLQEVFINKSLRTKRARYKTVDNRSKSYIMRNKKLAQGILNSVFKIDLPINFFANISGRTECINKEGHQWIYDVGHNLHAINAVKEELGIQNIKLTDVVICLSKTKDHQGIVELFKTEKVWGYQLNEKFYSPQELGITPLKNIGGFKSSGNVLFIGSFHLIHKLWEK